jgi:sulfite exporter TauE/SafE
MNLFTVFLTGLTSGSISCLTVQGGLLASAIANQKGEELGKNLQVTSRNIRGEAVTIKAQSFDQLDWLPVTMFLIGKLISHTLFGFFLGFIGSKLELSLPVRLFFQGFAAFFMFATAMNLLEAHPLFRYVVIQPPKAFTRIIRNSTKSKAVFTPFVIGLLTLLIPCGVTQSMEIVAVTSGNALTGAAILFFFVLGTSPLFGLVGVGMAKLSEFWKDSFLKAAAYLLIFLSLSSVNGMLLVLNSPVHFESIKNAILNPGGTSYNQNTFQPEIKNGRQEVEIQISSRGYYPNYFQVKMGIPVELTLRTENVFSCASDFIFPEFNLQARLGPNDKKVLSFTPTKKGSFRYSCSMGMYTGIMEVF